MNVCRIVLQTPGWKCEFFVIRLIFHVVQPLSIGNHIWWYADLKKSFKSSSRSAAWQLFMQMFELSGPQSSRYLPALHIPFRRSSGQRCGGGQRLQPINFIRSRDKRVLQKRDRRKTALCGGCHIRIFTLHGYQTRSFVDPQNRILIYCGVLFAVIKSTTKKTGSGRGTKRSEEDSVLELIDLASKNKRVSGKQQEIFGQESGLNVF